jgi:hypothetical protein
MNPVLSEIYSTVFTAAPYVIGAYALMWLVLLVFVFGTFLGIKKTERQIKALEDIVNTRLYYNNDDSSDSQSRNLKTNLP